MAEKMVYTVQEMVKTLGISLSCAYAICRQPNFPAIRVSPRRIVIPVDGLKAWMENNAGKVKSERSATTMILYSYYLTQRPAQPGAMPSEGLQPVNPGGDFGERIPVYYADPFPGDGHQLKLLCRAWGIVSYNRPLTVDEQLHYDLVPAPVKKAIWANHRVIGYTYMTQEEADRVNAIPNVGVYFGSNREWTVQGTEVE